MKHNWVRHNPDGVREKHKVTIEKLMQYLSKEVVECVNLR